jgi:hypothetical protein
MNVFSTPRSTKFMVDWNMNRRLSLAQLAASVSRQLSDTRDAMSRNRVSLFEPA